MSFPRTETELEAAGYEYEGSGRCRVLNAELARAQVGSRVWFFGEKRPYKVRARNQRYLVCTKPLNIHKTTLYTVVDLVEEIRGTEDSIFGMGAESDQDCQEMIQRLEGESQVSRRNYTQLFVMRIEPMTKG